MSLDIYPVKVITIVNPHLIWIEVSNPSNAENDFTFEQIGLYGILPLEKTLDVEFEEMKILKSETWVPACTNILRELCEESAELLFTPTYIDRRPTIFNDNIHKFGELVVKCKNGKQRALTKLLIKRNLAYLEISDFHHKLSTGKLNTKISKIKSQEILKTIENYYMKKQNCNKNWEKAVKNQTSVFQMSQNLNSLLTVSNLEKHNNEMLNKILERKALDFELCKEIDEDSVGCGIKQRSDVSDSACAIRYRMAMHKTKSDKYISLNDIKKFLNENSKKKEDTMSELSEQDSMASYNTLLNKRKQLYELSQRLKQNKALEDINNVQSETVSTTVDVETKNLESNYFDDSVSVVSSSNTYISPESREERRVYKAKQNNCSELLQDADTTSQSLKSRHSPKDVKTHKPKKYVNLKQIAYGPPEMDRQKFKIELKSTNFPEEDNKSAELDEKVIFDNSEQENSEPFENKYVAKPNIAKEITNNNNIKAIKVVADQVPTKKTSLLEMKMKALKNYTQRNASSSSNTSNKKSIDTDSDEDIDELVKKINATYKTDKIEEIKNKSDSDIVESDSVVVNYDVNPFRNIDPSISVFVDKLVSPVLMVHTKINRRIQPIHNLQEVCFNKHIHEVLKRMRINSPMMLQTVTWPIILRGYSLFMISPLNSGKTIGYLPAVCRLVSDSSPITDSAGPVSIIVCATAKLVASVEKMVKQFLGVEDRVLACYPGVDELHVTTTLLNGCDLLISTPVYLSNLLQKTDFDVDLRRLSTFVLDDCERLFKVYANEVKYFQFKIKEMLKKRVRKESKVQYILASRVWCDRMESLAFKAPDTVICIGAFQECVLYSKTNVSVSFIKNDPSLKLTYLQEFLESVDKSKKTVIVCASDDEVEWLETSLKTPSRIIYATNNNMTVHDLCNLSISWSKCEVPLVGPILICCDGNLTHMNITDAYNLVHFSLPRLYSLFSKRFSVLNSNYPSIFKNNSSSVKIKIFLEESNAEHLPKLISFIRRCTDIPDVLDEVCQNILKEKDEVKAKNFVPICDSLLMLGYCPDLFYCHERHTILKEHDLPIKWLPEKGFVTFKLLHYHSAISYSGQILANIVDGNVIKYPQTYSVLSLKMGMHYSKEINRQLHGFPNVGDICAVAMNANLYVRCQVVKILSTYARGNPNNVLIKLIDEEWYEVTRDIHLYYLPDKLKSIETRVAQIRLVNIRPKDNDITFSDLAKDHIKKIIDSEDDLYLRGHVALTIGNCIFVDTLEVCQDLTSLNEVVVKQNIRHELLKSHAISSDNLLPHLKQLCIQSGLIQNEKTERANCEVAEVNMKPEKDQIQNNLSENVSVSNEDVATNNNELIENNEEMLDIKKINNTEHVKDVIQKNPPHIETNQCAKGKWSNLDGDDFIRVYIAASKNPDNFFVRLEDFEPFMEVLLDEITVYVDNVENTDVNLRKGEIVLAKYPDDATYERARIDDIKGENVECFFLDQGDWMDIPITHLLPITEEIINKLPFQAIECRLLGVQPLDGAWNEHTNKWFFDYCFEGKNTNMKVLRAKYFTKTPSEFTGDFKYGVILYDSYTDSGEELLVNQLLIDLGLALKNTEEEQYLDKFINKTKEVKVPDNTTHVPSSSALLFQKPIRTVPLVDSDDSDDDRWDVVIDSDTVKTLVPLVENTPMKQLPPICNKPEKEERPVTNNILKPIMEDDKSQKPSALEPYSKDPEMTSTLPTKRPKLLWRQNLTTVTVSILIDVENYDLQIKDKGLQFSAELNNSKYEFDIELYGVIYKEKSSHYKQGLIIFVKLEKIIKKKWLELTRDRIKNWISYDVSTIDTSSEEEDEMNTKDLENYVRKTREVSDSEDDEFQDDLNR